MARAKKEDPPPPGSPAWMSTFSDLMNLLMCFFVLLFSMSTVDVEKYEQVVNSFAETFSVFTAGGSAIGDGVMVGNGVSQLSELSQYFTSMGMSMEGEANNDMIERNSNMDSDDSVNGGSGKEQDTEEDPEKDVTQDPEEMKENLESEQLKASEELAEKIEEYLRETGMTDQISIDYTTQYVLLTMNGALLFDSGSATIKEGAVPIVNNVGRILERYAANVVEIEGHTDNVPISNAAFSGNDELSGARALSVFRHLVENTALDPAKLKHSGRGEYVPVADNSTPEGRAKNRRVEVKIYNELSDAVD